MVKINNCAPYTKDNKYIVAREVNNEFWFWGAWQDFYAAQYAADEIGGKVYKIEDCILN